MIRASAEDYLETILLLNKRGGNVRAVDIAAEMNYTKPSVSIALRKLASDGMIRYDGGCVTLTPDGAAAAERVLERHATLAMWFTRMGVDEAIAARDACRMEHILSEETYAALKKLADAFV